MPVSVIIVDDDEDSRELLGALLRTRGFDVELAASGDDCLRSIADDVARVVLTDLEMPGMNGLELCAALKSRYPAVVSIVMSGLVSAQPAAVASGASAFLTKPVDVNAVVQAVQRAAIAQ